MIIINSHEFPLFCLSQTYQYFYWNFQIDGYPNWFFSLLFIHFAICLYSIWKQKPSLHTHSATQIFCLVHYNTFFYANKTDEIFYWLFYLRASYGNHRNEIFVCVLLTFVLINNNKLKWTKRRTIKLFHFSVMRKLYDIRYSLMHFSLNCVSIFWPTQHFV